MKPLMNNKKTRPAKRNLRFVLHYILLCFSNAMADFISKIFLMLSPGLFSLPKAG
ncbi:MAG: hypothetical protein V4658_05140 [Bacteroidota bacterium]